MATLSMRGRFILAVVGVLSIAALCTISLATYQLADIRADVTRILDHPQADSYAQQRLQAPDDEWNRTFGGQDQWMSARSFKDWKWIIGYSSPARIKYADVQAIGRKLSALHRNMILTFGLSAAAATAIFVLLTGRIVRSLPGTVTCPTTSGQMAEASQSIAEKPSARTGALDQALHETWDQRPSEADPSRKTAGTKAPQAPSTIGSDNVIPPEENELKGS